jgi:hypothetical protein
MLGSLERTLLRAELEDLGRGTRTELAHVHVLAR